MCIRSLALVLSTSIASLFSFNPLHWCRWLKTRKMAAFIGLISIHDKNMRTWKPPGTIFRQNEEKANSQLHTELLLLMQIPSLISSRWYPNYKTFNTSNGGWQSINQQGVTGCCNDPRNCFCLAFSQGKPCDQWAAVAAEGSKSHVAWELWKEIWCYCGYMSRLALEGPWSLIKTWITVASQF